MPYKNPEDERRFEREHRERRNAQRKIRQRLDLEHMCLYPRPLADAISGAEPTKNWWTTVLGIAFGVGLLFLGEAGIKIPNRR